jgi:hypothetical protein
MMHIYLFRALRPVFALVAVLLAFSMIYSSTAYAQAPCQVTVTPKDIACNSTRSPLPRICWLNPSEGGVGVSSNTYCFNTANDNWTPKIGLVLPSTGIAAKITMMSNARNDSAIYGSASPDEIRPLPVNFFNNTWKISIPKLVLHKDDQYIFTIDDGSNPYWTITGSSVDSFASNSNLESITLPVTPFTLYGMWKGSWTNTVYLADKSDTTVPKDGSVVVIHAAGNAGVSTIRTRSGKDILIHSNDNDVPPAFVKSILINNIGSFIVLIYDAKLNQWSQFTRLS